MMYALCGKLTPKCSLYSAPSSSPAIQHFGTKNNILHERMALFSVLTPFEEKRQDDYQVRFGDIQ